MYGQVNNDPLTRWGVIEYLLSDLLSETCREQMEKGITVEQLFFSYSNHLVSAIVQKARAFPQPY
jgi:hypothetical protein